jgi:CelD/BcsL family acetyltransferase involved in cellulose biosynthesis
MREFRRARFERRTEEDILSEPAFLEFYERIAVEGAPTGFARTYTLSLDARLIGVVFGLAHRGRFMVLLSAFDNAFHKSSPGYILFEDVVADCIARGDITFDLTVGDEGYKLNLGAKPKQLFEIWASGSLLGYTANLCLRQGWLKRIARPLSASAGRPERV